MRAVPVRGKRRQYRFPRPDGTWLHVTEWGAPAGEITVVLTHGWSLSSWSWEDVAEGLVAVDPRLRVIAYDHRGHGLSARSRASLEMLADDLADLIEAQIPHGPLVFGGHSMGGMTLMTLAERHPQLLLDRAVGVALVATSAGNLPAIGRKMLQFALLRKAMEGLMAWVRLPSRPLFLLRQFSRLGMFGAKPRRHDMNRVVWQAAQSHPRAVADMGLSMMRHQRFDALEVFASVNTVVMVGSRDPITPVRHARDLAAHIPGARFVEYPTAGHQLPYERRGEIVAHLLALSRHGMRWAEAAG